MHLGWNTYTVSLAGTAVFALLHVWATLHQRKIIYATAQARSVSVIRFSYSVAYSAVVLTYGLSIKNPAFIVSGSLCGIANSFVLWGILRYKAVKCIEYAIAFFFLCCVAATIALPQEGTITKGRFFLGFALLGMFATAHQAREIFLQKDSGQVDIRPILVAIAGSVFWTVYAFACNEWTIKILSPTVIVAHTTLATIWYRYRNASQ